MVNERTWKTLGSEEIFQSGFFRLRRDRCELPDQRVMPAYYVVEFTDWVHVLPLTKKGEAVMVRQYRYAAGEHFLEVPGGTCDPRAKESHEEAARRELREETGYTPGRMVYLGYHYPNPALQDNRMHSFLALDCELTHSPELDPYEDLTVELMNVSDLYKMVFAGEIRHSLNLGTLALALPHLKEWVK